MKKNAQKLVKVSNRVSLVERLFRYFINNDWCFENRQLYETLVNMDPEERKIFNCDPKTIEWKSMSGLNVYGLQKYMFRMDVSPPFSEQRQLITPLNINYFQDSQNFL